jgi:hypothetical protein
MSILLAIALSVTNVTAHADRHMPQILVEPIYTVQTVPETVIVVQKPSKGIVAQAEWHCGPYRRLLASSNEGDWSVDRHSLTPYQAKQAGAQVVRVCEGPGSFVALSR